MGARDLLADLATAGVTVTVDGERLLVQPASLLTTEMRVALRESKPELLLMLAHEPARPHKLSDEGANRAHAVPWDEATCNLFVARLTLFIRLGFNGTDADDLAEQLHLRDVDRAIGRDDRVMCIECRHYRPRRSEDCANVQVAGSRLRGTHMVTTPQRCGGFASAPLSHAGGAGPDEDP